MDMIVVISGKGNGSKEGIPETFPEFTNIQNIKKIMFRVKNKKLPKTVVKLSASWTDHDLFLSSFASKLWIIFDILKYNRNNRLMKWVFKYLTTGQKHTNIVPWTEYTRYESNT